MMAVAEVEAEETLRITAFKCAMALLRSTAVGRDCFR